MKVLSYGFKDLSLESYNEILKMHDNEESIRFREDMEKDLTYVGTFALEDPLRDNIEESVNLIRFGCHI